MKILILLLTFAFFSCSSDSSETGETSPQDFLGNDSEVTKSLFDLWIKNENENFSAGNFIVLGLNLASGFNDPVDLEITTADNFTCDCSISVNGSQSAGTYTINECVWRFASESGSVDCSALHETGLYALNENVLSLTNSANEVVRYE